MKQRYLEVTYRGGKALAAYFYLPRSDGDTAARTVEAIPGLLVDYSPDGRPIGIEMTAPAVVTVQTLNRLLSTLGQHPANEADLLPLSTAA